MGIEDRDAAASLIALSRECFLEKLPGTVHSEVTHS